MEDKRNLFTAIGLSLLVLVGWQYFVTPRFVTPKPAQIETQQEGNPASTPQPPQAPSPSRAASAAARHHGRDADERHPGDFARRRAQIIPARRHSQ